MSSGRINEAYNLAIKSGALGGKLIGAGGGGFLLFYATDKSRLRHAMRTNRHGGAALPFRLRRHQTDDRALTRLVRCQWSVVSSATLLLARDH